MLTRRALKVTTSMLAAAAGFGIAGTASANDDVTALMNDPANVVMPSITYNGWNYSTLDQITLDNVADLQIAWTWQIGILDSHEASPLVVGDMMYIVSPMTSGEASCESRIPICQVQAIWSWPTLSSVIWSSVE